MTHTWKISFGKEGDAAVRTGHEAYYFFQDSEAMVSEPQAAYGAALDFHETAELFEYLSFTQQDVAEVMEVDPSTLFRWRKENRKLTKAITKNLLDIDQIVAKGIRVFGTEELFSEWLHAPNSSLAGQQPVTFLKNPYGISKVDQALEAMSWGNIL